MNTIMQTLTEEMTSNLISVCKLFKRDDILIFRNDVAFATTWAFTFVKKTYIGLWNGCYIMHQLKVVCDKNLFRIDFDQYMNLYVWLNGENTPYCIRNQMLSPQNEDILALCNELVLRTSDSMEDITDNVVIQNIINSVSKDGNTSFIYNNHIMTLCKSLFPINKSDKLLIGMIDDVNEDGHIEYFWSVFRILKKKNVVVDIIIKFRYL